MDAAHNEETPESPDTLYEPQQAHILSKEKQAGQDAETKSVRTVHSVTASEHSTIADGNDHDIEAALQRTLTAKKPVIKVARSKRRGLFARFSVVAEVTEPKDYKNNTKWFITFVIAIAGAAAPVGSAIIFRRSYTSQSRSPD